MVKIAIADDNEKMLNIMGKVLAEQNDFEVVGMATNGLEIINIIKDKQPDIVLLDIIMPQIDGLTVMEKVKTDKDVTKEPTFIVISAVGRESVTEDAFNMGATYYIMKPFDNQMLINRIRYVKSNKKLLDNKRAALVTDNSEAVSDRSLEADITEIIHDIGIPAHIKGYQYIREGIMLSFYDKNMLHYITKCLYPTIAKKYKTTSSSVERTIRHAIEVAFRRGNRQVLEEIFSNTICSKKTKPTNSEFIALLTDKLRLEYRTRNAS